MKSIQSILDDCGLSITRTEPVHGGDINRCYCLYTDAAKYFLKVNEEEKFPGMFSLEARGLDALRNNSTLTVPHVLRSGIVNGEQYLLLEWLEKGAPGKNFWEKFGTGLAMMHKEAQPFFGWPSNNYIGSLSQNNTAHSSWDAFYTECRMLPLVQRLFDAGLFSRQDLLMAEQFCKNIVGLFPSEPPALLHGDLWGGNYLITAGGDPAVFDPAVYYGHREMDIGMTRLFGGFDERFYNAYHEAYPLEKGWRERLPLTQLYPLLVHAVLFGGGYINQSRMIMERTG